MSTLVQFRKDLVEAASRNKLNGLYLRLADVLTLWDGLPEDVMAKVEIEIVAMFDAAWNDNPIPSPSVPVIFTVEDDTIIVACLRRSLLAA